MLAYFKDEPAGGAVSELIANARDHDTPLLMSAVNAGEVWYIIIVTGDREFKQVENDIRIQWPDTKRD